MTDSHTSTSLRLLILTLNLLNTDIGLSTRKLMAIVPGYEGVDPDSDARKFERDLATLRETGLDVQTLPTLPPRYRIPRSHYRGDVELTTEEFDLLSRAAESWTDVAATQGGVVVNKLRAVSSSNPHQSPHKTSIPLEGGAYTPVLHGAILRSQPVSFDYQSRSGLERREVAPWNLIARGKAVYLWGFDLNRWDARLFRLSRFRSIPEVIGEEQSTTPTGALAAREFDDHTFLISPLLAVKSDAAPLVRLRTKSSSDRRWNLPDEWDLLQGLQDDISAWESAIAREADAVVVLEPEYLKRSMLENLRLAAAWSEPTQNVQEVGDRG